MFKDKFKSKKIIRAISPVHQISPKRIKSPNPMMNFDTNFKVKSAQSISRVSFLLNNQKHIHSCLTIDDNYFNSQILSQRKGLIEQFK